MKNVVVGILGIAGLAASASAAATWTTQMRYSVTGPAGSGYSSTIINSGGVGPTNVTVAGVYSVTVQVGIFNLQGAGAGESNQGLFNWAARATGTGFSAGENYVVANATSRISPFNFGPSTAFGGAVVGGNVIDGNSVTPGSLIQASRDVAGGASAVWNDGDPQPTAPVPGALGADTYTNVFRFQIIVGSGTDPIVTTFSGSAGPVLAWSPFGVNPPFEGDPGSVTFLGITRGTADGGPLSAFADSSFTLPRIPAPGSVALLGLGGLLAARRRRA
ncbi:MAG: PEP-CTERM sorting domain-containing protein [Phycisphaeraceae bacterium]|nr:PEP-CTERM sorting domain-containing protein [Phycisphaeraceae bacterium]